MRRREFIAGVASATAALPLVGHAQQADRVRRIGVLNAFDANSQFFRSLDEHAFQALSQMGWENGRNVQIIERRTSGDINRAVPLAKELVALQPHVIFAVGTSSAVALQRETHTVPIVFVATSDPVGAGLVASLPRPGGNITGFSNTEETFGGKLLSLLKTVAPRIKRAAAIFNPDTAPGRGLYHLGSFETTARALAIEPIAARVHSDDDIEAAITSLGREEGGLVALPDAFINNHRGMMIAVSRRKGIPTIFDAIGFAKDGGLLQYGPDFRDMWRGAALYVDRILRGAKPSDLPVELPTKYVLVVNLQTAKAIGLTIPETLLATADEVIE
jgi:putative tryptophan/tyrosine transport system substrate-binding protein